MADQIPLTLVIDNQDRALGVKQFSIPSEECLGVEYGGLGKIVIEGNSVLIGNDTDPIVPIPRKTLQDDTGFITINGSDSFISNGNLNITVDNSELNIAAIMLNQQIPLNKIGRWIDGFEGWENAEDDLFLLVADPGEF